MHKLGLLTLVLLLLGTGLSACHTTAGFGEDVSRTGDAIERNANQHAP